MKIAILHCRKSSNVCTGAACFKAYNDCSKNFEQYKYNKPQLAAFFDCGGCSINQNTDDGMIEKMNRLKFEGIEKIHIGICINEKCPRYNDIIQMLDEYEIPYEFGTH
ncbi:MAG: CGGC domain-containing protein [Maledivibacter sp.]|jgi:predicted metal-binding protein|nr:CGGC domain-containing protein [Maledivibacter sp.]